MLRALGRALEGPRLGAPSLWAEGVAGMVHRPRLVATEPDRVERLPMAAAEGVFAFDGRLDDRAGLGATLGVDRPSDGSLLAGALARWGDGTPERILGDYAFAHWAPARRRLVLAVDPMALRSLYFHCDDRRIVFATVLRALLALPGVPREVDEGAFADLLVRNGGEPHRTLYRAIDRVPAAHCLAFADGRQTARRYWRPDPARRERLRSDRDYVERGRELLGRAVADRMRARDPIVITLSGGLDSTAVAATAALLDPARRIGTLTRCPAAGAVLPRRPGPRSDERALVEALARRHPSLDCGFIDADAPEAVETEPAGWFAARALPALSAIPAGWGWPIMRQVMALGSQVVLSGSLGNLTLSWAGRDAGWRRLASEILPFGLRQRIQRRTGGSDAAWPRYSPLAPAFAAEIGLEDRYRRYRVAPDHVTQGDPRLAPGLGLPCAGGQAVVLDIMAAQRAATGVELRLPLADMRLVEFCLAIPDDQFRRGAATRLLARRVLADRLPAEILDNPVRGAQAPEWFSRLAPRRAALGAALSRIERSPLAARILDLPRLKRLLDAFPADADAAEARRSDYLSVLANGIHAGQFIFWLEGRNE
jgi:asparagine synthase (glutamine-hydrolysing)